ncbi:hypothetical protein B0J18DRAFT_481841 [Chaetomium sp. MPI-SDFR-AT-0129]|nr:hypothetical protein B0J18DRAFT_481841 [Chaetomium sp. MPI-SDFR-AT-0129]
MASRFGPGPSAGTQPEAAKRPKAPATRSAITRHHSIAENGQGQRSAVHTPQSDPRGASVTSKHTTAQKQSTGKDSDKSQQPLVRIAVNYLGGLRNYVRADMAVVRDIEDQTTVYMGIDPFTLHPVFMKAANNLCWPSSFEEGISSTLGRGSAVRMTPANLGKLCNSFVPTEELLRDGHLAHQKSALLGFVSLPKDEASVEARKLQAIRLSIAVQRGLPLEMRTNIGYTPQGKRINLDNLPDGLDYPRYRLPVFKLDPLMVPEKASILVEKWMEQHPNDLLYPQVALQKVLQWIHVLKTEDFNEAVGPGSYVKWVSLGDWLRVAHLYESFHHIYRLVFYIHPANFTHHILRGGGNFGSTRLHTKPNHIEQALLALMLPLASQPLGFTLPSFVRGSTMVDLAALSPEHGFLPRTTQNLEAIRQPDWRCLYFPTIPIWDELFENNARVPELSGPNPPVRELMIPRSWIPENARYPVRDAQPLFHTWGYSGPGTTSVPARVSDNWPPSTRMTGPDTFWGRAEPSEWALAWLLYSPKQGKHKWAIRGPPGFELVDIGIPHPASGAIPQTSSDTPALKTPPIKRPSQDKDSGRLQFEDMQRRGPASQISRSHQPRNAQPGADITATSTGPEHHRLAPTDTPSQSLQDSLQKACSLWFFAENSARLNDAVKRKLSITDLKFSSVDGLLELPAAGNGQRSTSSRPVSEIVTGTGERPVSSKNRPLAKLLWEEFLESVSELAYTPPWWEDLIPEVSAWLRYDSDTSWLTLLERAGKALEMYLQHALPIHITHILLGIKADIPHAVWITGKLGKGRLQKGDIPDILQRASRNSEQHEIQTIQTLSIMEKFPAKAQDLLAELFEDVFFPNIPRIFRHLFAGGCRAA